MHHVRNISKDKWKVPKQLPIIIRVIYLSSTKQLTSIGLQFEVNFFPILFARGGLSLIILQGKLGLVFMCAD